MENRIMLTVKLLKDDGLKMKIEHLDKRFLSYSDQKNSCDDVFSYFISSDEHFSMYSSGNAAYLITDDDLFCVVLPDKTHYDDCIITHYFKDDDERYKFLKTMYDHLDEWANTWEGFKNDLKRDGVFVHDELWIC